MSRNVPLNKWTVIIFLMILGIAYTGLIEFLFRTHQQAMRHETQQWAEDELSLIRYKLEASIVADIYAAKSLSVLISVHSQSVDSIWENVSVQTVEQGQFIRFVALAPNDVITYVYPEDNVYKSLPGTELRHIDDLWNNVQQARELQDVVVTGPIKLAWGDVTAIVNAPVFLDSPRNQVYWGCVSIGIDIDKFFDFLNIAGLEKRFDVAVRVQDHTDTKGAIFWGKEDVFQDIFAQELFYFPNGSWQIAVAEKQDSAFGQFPWYQYYLVRLIGYSLFIILSLSFWIVYRLYEKSTHLSMRDELTELPNRRCFMERLSQKFEDEKQNGQLAESVAGFGLLCIDIDKFKQINDQYGHLIGDQVLVECANRIRSSVRENDCVARIGGDEFLVLLSDSGKVHDIQDVIDRIRKIFRITPFYCEGYYITVDVSIGYTVYRHEMENASEMIKYADNHMYAEKYQR